MQEQEVTKERVEELKQLYLEDPQEWFDEYIEAQQMLKDNEFYNAEVIDDN